MFCVVFGYKWEIETLFDWVWLFSCCDMPGLGNKKQSLFHASLQA